MTQVFFALLQGRQRSIPICQLLDKTDVGPFTIVVYHSQGKSQTSIANKLQAPGLQWVPTPEVLLF